MFVKNLFSTMPTDLYSGQGMVDLVTPRNLCEPHFPIPARDFEFDNTTCDYSLTQVRLGFSGLKGWVLVQGIDLKGVPQSDEVREKTEKAPPPSTRLARSGQTVSSLLAG